jgi:hypothetical protein
LTSALNPSEGTETEAEGTETEAEGTETEAEGTETEAEGTETKTEGTETKTEGEHIKIEAGSIETEVEVLTECTKRAPETTQDFNPDYMSITICLHRAKPSFCIFFPDFWALNWQIKHLPCCQ